ncbi:MAG: class I SAM-dependent rRNA methyltransferase [Salinivirgaceae bacterium]|nr:class I SAM-dependent rRNA methyltransferase [Salinivirgaceae bacterium]
MNNFVKIILKSGKEQSVRRLHPWIFSGAIKQILGAPTEGDVVEVYDNHNEFLALGHYQPSSIAVRIFSFEKVELDRNYWKNKIASAIECRRKLGFFDAPDTNVFRLVHGEGDGLPGLVIDYYNGTAVFQAHSAGMYNLRNDVAQILVELLGDKINAVYDKSSQTLPFKAGLEPVDGYLYGNLSQNIVVEHGNKFEIDWEKGQKTGFFIDQRENRRLLGEYSRGKKVCNIFGYTGGFSIYALKAGAELVHTVDASKLAIDLTDRNVEINFGNSVNHKGFAMDAFDFLSQSTEKYDVIILDPPAFAKHQKNLNNALNGYKRINQRALEQIAHGGILFTFSCSQAVDKEDFRKAVFAASVNAKRNVRILHFLSQPIDHPISMFHPESEYLKGLVLYVD